MAQLGHSVTKMISHRLADVNLSESIPTAVHLPGFAVAMVPEPDCASKSSILPSYGQPPPTND